MSQLVARHMVERGGGGKIVFISSVHARIPFARSVAYNAGKSGLTHMALTIAAELLPHRINVNVIEPGWIDTPGEHATFGSETHRLGRPDAALGPAGHARGHRQGGSVPLPRRTPTTSPARRWWSMAACASAARAGRAQRRSRRGERGNRRIESKTVSYFHEDALRARGGLVLPAELRQRDGIEPGHEFEIERMEAGEYRLVRTSRPANQGLVNWLLACPVKGFPVAIESESTGPL